MTNRAADISFGGSPNETGESPVPPLSEKLKEPETMERKFVELVKSAEQAAVLVLVY